MNDLGLDLASLTSPGRKPARVEGEVLRPVEAADIATLSLPAPGAIPIKRLSERHHQLARLLARGVRGEEAAVALGYDPARVSVLRSSPAFEELLSFYRSQLDAEFADFGETLRGLSADAVLILRERLEDEPEAATLGQLLEIAKFGADRTGFGPQSKQEVTVKTDLGARLAAARARLVEQQQRALGAIPDAEVVEGTEDG
jgi:hypothetical protein